MLSTISLYTSFLFCVLSVQASPLVLKYPAGPDTTPAPTLVDRGLSVCQLDSLILSLLTKSSYSSSALSFCSSFIHVPVVTSTTSTSVPKTTVPATFTPAVVTATAATSTPLTTTTITVTPGPVTDITSTEIPTTTVFVSTTALTTVTDTTTTPIVTVTLAERDVLVKRSSTPNPSSSSKTSSSNSAAQAFSQAIATIASSVLSQACSCISSNIVKSTTDVVYTAPTSTVVTTITLVASTTTSTPIASTSTITVTNTGPTPTVFGISTASPTVETDTLTITTATVDVTSTAPAVTATAFVCGAVVTISPGSCGCDYTENCSTMVSGADATTHPAITVSDAAACLKMCDDQDTCIQANYQISTGLCTPLENGGSLVSNADYTAFVFTGVCNDPGVDTCATE